jgi:hypothetical protein
VCRDHYAATENRQGYVRWDLVFRNWIRKQDEIDRRQGTSPRQPQPGSYEMPQQQGRRGEGATEENRNVVHLGDYIKEAQK